MALVPRAGVSMDASTGMLAPQLTGMLAGAAIVAGDACYLASTGLVHPANGTAATAPAVFIGIAAAAAPLGEAVTVFGPGARFRYDSAGGLTIGARYFVAATAGRLDTAATTGGLRPVAEAVSATDIRIISLA